MENQIEKKVHQLYWQRDVNCARTSLLCLGEIFGLEISDETLRAAIGLHGAGGFRAQCGLVEGPLMFIGIYFSARGLSDDETAEICRRYAEVFQNEFGSLRCFDLRSGGFSEDDPPHVCEGLTVRAVEFAYRFIGSISRSAAAAE